MISTAHPEFLTIDQMHHEVAARFSADFFHVLQINDGRAMHAKKQLWIESLFNRSHGLAEKMRLRAGADTNVVLFGADPTDIRHGKKQDTSARLENDTRGVLLRPVFFPELVIGFSFPAPDLVASSGQRGVETLGTEGL